MSIQVVGARGARRYRLCVHEARVDTGVRPPSTQRCTCLSVCQRRIRALLGSRRARDIQAKVSFHIHDDTHRSTDLTVLTAVAQALLSFP